MDGNGTMKLGSGAFEGAYSFKSRMEDGTGTNPEELIGAAHAGCFSMAFSVALGKNGFAPKTIHTSAAIRFEKVGEGFAITRIDLTTDAEVPAQLRYVGPSGNCRQNELSSKIHGAGLFPGHRLRLTPVRDVLSTPCTRCPVPFLRAYQRHTTSPGNRPCTLSPRLAPSPVVDTFPRFGCLPSRPRSTHRLESMAEGFGMR